jgi:hypothetical protein
MTTSDSFKTMNDLGDRGWERLNALGDLHLRTWERLADRQMEAVNLLLEQGLRQARLTTESGGCGELWKGQLELSREMGERMMTEGKENLRLVGEVRDAYRSWLQQGMSEISSVRPKNSDPA